MPSNIPVIVMLSTSLAGIIGIFGWVISMTQHQDNAAEIKKNLAVVSSIVSILVIILGGAAYIYFMSDTTMLIPFLIIMTFINLALSLIAVSTASLSVVYPT